VSENNTLAFIDQLNLDSNLRARVQALPTGDLPALVSFASEIGYPFTTEEWRQATAVFAGELDDEALDRIAGGALNAYLESPTMDARMGSYAPPIDPPHNTKTSGRGNFEGSPATRRDPKAGPDKGESSGHGGRPRPR